LYDTKGNRSAGSFLPQFARTPKWLCDGLQVAWIGSKMGPIGFEIGFGIGSRGKLCVDYKGHNWVCLVFPRFL
jgi:hypothetical protein